MKKIILILLLIFLSSCKDNFDVRKDIANIKIKDTLIRVDYHKMINIVLDTFNKYNKNKIIYVKYEPAENPIHKRYKDFLSTTSKLNKEEKELAIKFLETGNDSFCFNKSELSKKSKKLLQNYGKETDKNITYHFTGFLSNDTKDLVISTVGAIMNNESFTTKNSGASLIMLFKKEKNDEWKLSNYITTVEY